MLLILEEPYKSIYKRGYLRSNNQGRQVVDLVIDNNNRTTTSYARYLMSVKLGYIVSDDFEVDHADNDKTNDDINNLQVLTKAENKEKEALRYLLYEQVRYGYHCAFCDISFILTEREMKMRLAQNVELAFCSKSCSAKYHYSISSKNLAHPLSIEDKQNIKHLRSQGLSVYKISAQTGFARNTVMKYW